MKSSTLILIVAGIGVIFVLLATPRKIAGKPPTTTPPSRTTPAVVHDATITSKGIVTTSTDLVNVTQDGQTLPQTLQAAAIITQKPVISSTSLAGMGGESALHPPSDLIALNRNGQPSSDPSNPSDVLAYASPSTDAFYSKSIVGYNSDGSPIYAYAKLGGVQFGPLTESSYKQLQADIASGAMVAAAADVLAYRREARLGL